MSDLEIVSPVKRPVGRPSEYDPCVNGLAIGFAQSEQGATIIELAAHLGVARDTLYTWAKAHPEFADTLKYYQTLGGAALAKRVRSNTGADIGGMFMLKAQHGFNDRPAPEAINQGQGQGKVDITIRVLGGKHKRDEAVDVEYQVVSSNSRQDTDR